MRDSYQKALQYAFLLLKYRGRSALELKRRLRRKKFSESIIDKVVAYLLDSGYIDDREFAFGYARQKSRDSFGERKVAFELKKFGIDHETIREALTQAAEEFDKKEMIKSLIRRKCRNKTRSAIIRYLAQRGFEYEDIRQGLTDED